MKFNVRIYMKLEIGYKPLSRLIYEHIIFLSWLKFRRNLIKVKVIIIFAFIQSKCGTTFFERKIYFPFYDFAKTQQS